MLETPLNAFHVQQGGKLVEFAGWSMPVMYRGIIDEHVYTREHCSVFDVSHMGRIEFRGGGAEAFLQRLCTRNLGEMTPGLSRYGHVCRDDGGILDDVIVSRDEDQFLMVCNASNREKLLKWFARQHDGFDVTWTDRTIETAMVAIQGPEALETLGQLLPVALGDLKRYHFKTGVVMGARYWIARSGYTGEDGAEIILPAQFAPAAMQMLMDRSAALGRAILPAGLGARDTLRLEAGMPLYGHELSENWDSLTAGQAWCVDLSKDFVGQAAMKKLQEAGLRRKLIGFELAGKRIARDGCKIFRGGREVGFVTSGTQSPTLGKVIGMGLIDAAAGEIGTELEFDVRGKRESGRVLPLPFYKRRNK